MNAQKIILPLSIMVVAGAIGYGFMETGGPGQQRKERLDSMTLSRLGSIENAIDRYYEKEKKLPVQLDELLNSRPGKATYLYNKTDLEDPQKNDSSFEYRILGEKTYQLCATFETDTRTQTRNNRHERHRYNYGYYGDNDLQWRHPKGAYCFDLAPSPDKK